MQFYLKNYNFCEYVEFGAISGKIWYFVNNFSIEIRN